MVVDGGGELGCFINYVADVVDVEVEKDGADWTSLRDSSVERDWIGGGVGAICQAEPGSADSVALETKYPVSGSRLDLSLVKCVH